jgi:hypothetical protein
MVDVMILTLTAYVHMLMPVLGMPFNFLKDVVIRLCGISSPGFLLLLVSFGLLLSNELGHLIWHGPCGAMRVYGSIPPQLVPKHHVF